MTLHKEILHQIQWRKMLLLCTQRQPWRKIFPLGIKAIFAILRQSLHDRRNSPALPYLWSGLVWTPDPTREEGSGEKPCPEVS